MVTKATLYKVQSDNLRYNQIGGMEDGITEEVAADLGYSTPDSFAQLITNLEKPKDISEQVEKAARATGKIVCADCGQVIPCQHAGNGYTKGV